jgi:phosphatidylinositol alpha-1,6-mannosyltransferase
VTKLPNTLLFTFDYKPRPGGKGEHAYRVALEAARRAKWVGVLAPAFPGGREFDAGQPFSTYRVPRIPVLDWLLHLITAVRLVKAHRVGLVYCVTSYPCAPICRLLRFLTGVEFAVTVHGHEVVYSRAGFRQRLKALLRPLQIGVLASADKMFAVSSFTAGNLARAGIGPERIRIIYNGVDPEVFDTSPEGGSPPVSGLPSDGRMILTVARLDAHKGQDTVIRAMPAILREVPEAHYVIAGDGPNREYLEALAGDCGVADRTVFTGHVAGGRLLDLYRACDVFVMASRVEGAHAEGFGIVFLEAGLMGKPVVGGRSGGIPDAVAEGETGFLVDPGDPSEIAGAVVRILLDGDLAARLGAAGRRRVLDEFTWERTVDRIAASLEP